MWQRLDGLEFFVNVDAEGCLDRCFIQLDGSIEEWALGGSENVLLFDPTHGTNRHRLKLAAFVTVAPSGQTVILAICLLEHEDEITFEWLFLCFQRVFRVPPLSFFTDGDVAMDRAVEKMKAGAWKSTIHLLCVFHLSKNFFQHLHPLFSCKSAWRVVFTLFWQTAKNSDDSFQGEPFDAAIQEIKDLVSDAGAEAPVKRDAGLAWLGRLAERRCKWAACHVWQFRTWGVFSTQRAEMLQRVMKLALKANSELCKLVPVLIEMNNKRRDLRAVDEIRKTLKFGVIADSFPPFLQSLIGSVAKPNLTGFAMDLLLGQFKQAMQYIASPLATDGEYLISRVRSFPSQFTTPQFDANGLLQDYSCAADIGLAEAGREDEEGRLTTLRSCSCQFLTAWGIPCRHMIYLCFHLQQVSFPLERIGMKWRFVSPAFKQQAVDNLLRFVPPVQASSSAAAPAPLTKQERHSLAMAALRPLAELASLSEAFLTCVRMHAFDVSSHLRQNGQSSLLMPGADAVTGSRDPASLKSVLGLVYMPADYPATLQETDLVKRFVGYKWAAQGRGGWCFGIIHSQSTSQALLKVPHVESGYEELIDKPANFQVHHQCDNTYTDVALHLENFTKVAVAPMHSWMLLVEKDWTHVPATVLNPGKPPTKGRRATARKSVPGPGGPSKKGRPAQ